MAALQTALATCASAVACSAKAAHSDWLGLYLLFLSRAFKAVATKPAVFFLTRREIY
jgi:hypothetical protein